MYALKGNSEFCFPENLNVSRDEIEGNIEINELKILKNLLKRFQPHILLPVVYFSSLLHSFEHIYILHLYVAGRGGQKFFTCCPAGCIAFI
jgi:hypothetical protein